MVPSRVSKLDRTIAPSTLELTDATATVGGLFAFRIPRLIAFDRRAPVHEEVQRILCPEELARECQSILNPQPLIWGKLLSALLNPS